MAEKISIRFFNQQDSVNTQFKFTDKFNDREMFMKGIDYSYYGV